MSITNSISGIHHAGKEVELNATERTEYASNFSGNENSIIKSFQSPTLTPLEPPFHISSTPEFYAAQGAFDPFSNATSETSVPTLNSVPRHIDHDAQFYSNNEIPNPFADDSSASGMTVFPEPVIPSSALAEPVIPSFPEPVIPSTNLAEPVIPSFPEPVIPSPILAEPVVPSFPEPVVPTSNIVGPVITALPEPVIPFSAATAASGFLEPSARPFSASDASWANKSRQSDTKTNTNVTHRMNDINESLFKGSEKNQMIRPSYDGYRQVVAKYVINKPESQNSLNTTKVAFILMDQKLLTVIQFFVMRSYSISTIAFKCQSYTRPIANLDAVFKAMSLCMAFIRPGLQHHG